MPIESEKVDVVVLAGGLGTRLRTVVPDVPKALAEINGRPFLDHLLTFLDQFGAARRVVLALGYLAERVVAHYRDASSFHFDLRFSIEQQPLDTAGAVRLALASVESADVLVLNGDSYIELDLETMLTEHRRTGAAATIALRHVDDISRFGRVELDDKGRVAVFAEKPPRGGPGYVNAGIYLCRREVFDGVPPEAACSLEKQLFPELAAHGELFGFVSSGRFIDIGVPESYRAAPEFFRKGG